jgi:hypothetical protein
MKQGVSPLYFKKKTQYMLMAEAKKYSTYCLEQFFFTNNGKHFAIVSRKKNAHTERI